jgi:hypothetical protein
MEMMKVDTADGAQPPIIKDQVGCLPVAILENLLQPVLWAQPQVELLDITAINMETIMNLMGSQLETIITIPMSTGAADLPRFLPSHMSDTRIQQLQKAMGLRLMSILQVLQVLQVPHWHLLKQM